MHDYSMYQFDTIRPYRDDEVNAVLQSLAANHEFLDTIVKYKFPRSGKAMGWLLRPLSAFLLRRQTTKINSVGALQSKVAPYVERSIKQATDGITFSGIDNLSAGQANLYLANHRDIVMDPAYVNFALYQSGRSTPRIAIGDNLLQKPFVSDLMRLNKSFIVHRSLSGRREKLEAFKLLSGYINHSILNEHESIWIAQAEGRAKDGNDRTDSAILKMFHMACRDLDFSQAIARLRLVPVSISYEYDPCDLDKARELYIRATTGSYTKQPGEDDKSIAKGITGYKGRVHIHFAQPVSSNFADAKQLAAHIDQNIWRDYRLFPVHYLAWHMWQQRNTDLTVPQPEQLFNATELAQAKSIWQEKLALCPAEHQQYLIQQYANPLQNQLQQAQPLL